jgi:hypothetical protein
MTREGKTLIELEKIVADFVGFDQKVIIVSRVGEQGDFAATVTDATAWLTKSTAQLEVDKACVKLRAIYRLEP